MFSAARIWVISPYSGIVRLRGDVDRSHISIANGAEKRAVNLEDFADFAEDRKIGRSRGVGGRWAHHAKRGAYSKSAATCVRGRSGRRSRRRGFRGLERGCRRGR